MKRILWCIPAFAMSLYGCSSVYSTVVSDTSKPYLVKEITFPNTESGQNCNGGDYVKYQYNINGTITCFVYKDIR